MKEKNVDNLVIRKATMNDIKGLHSLINLYAKKKLMLPRSLSFLYDNIRDFYVVENRRKSIIGCCALHVVWENLAEVKSLVVHKEYQRHGLGSKLVSCCLDEAHRLGVSEVFALTYNPDFFMRNGFKKVHKSKLPAKVWRECIECHMFPNCNEIAVLKKL